MTCICLNLLLRKCCILKILKSTALIYLFLMGTGWASVEQKKDTKEINFLGLERGAKHIGIYGGRLYSNYKWGMVFEGQLSGPIEATGNYYYTFPAKIVEKRLGGEFQGESLYSLQSFNLYLTRPVHRRNFLTVQVFSGICIHLLTKWLEYYDKERKIEKDGKFYIKDYSRASLAIAFGVSFHFKKINILLSYGEKYGIWSVGVGLELPNIPSVR